MNEDKQYNIEKKEINNKKNTSPQSVIWIMVYVLIGLLAFLLIKGSISVGAEKAKTTFNDVYSKEKQEVYNSYYDKYYDKYEKKYHTSNDVYIMIESIKEIKELEVLRVSDVEYIIDNEDDNKDSIIAWLEVPGEGSFVVDLAGAEFIKNDSRKYVHVKLPYPELKNIRIQYENVQKLVFINKWANDSMKDGEEISYF